MAVKIRLLRMGRKKSPFYRIVVMDSRSRRDGRYLEKIGHYNPVSKPAEVIIDKEKVLKWLEKGAEPTNTVFNLLQKEGIALDWHLTRSNASEQVRNVEMQKFELAKKLREDKKTVAKTTVKEETVITPEPEVVPEVKAVVIEEAKIEEKVITPEPEVVPEAKAAVIEEVKIEETVITPEPEVVPEAKAVVIEEKPVEEAAPVEAPKEEDAKPEEPASVDQEIVAEEAVEETKAETEPKPEPKPAEEPKSEEEPKDAK